MIKLIAEAGPGLQAWFAAAPAPTRTVPWSFMLFVVVIISVGSVARLLAEWQRRKTLVAVMKDARPGTVIEQDRGRGGPRMRIEIRCGTEDDTSSPGGQ